jgi:UDP-N-acetylmuramate--alanine ligase
MSAIAQVLCEMGHVVSGSDIVESLVTHRLGAMGVQVSIGHNADSVANCDLVTFSTAIRETNIELVAAVKNDKTRVMTRAEMLAAICNERTTIAVAGTHGKTTTSSMLMQVFDHAGNEPSFVIGGDVLSLDSGAGWRDGELLVVEADESDGTHLVLPVASTIITNIDEDHLDRYSSLSNITQSFDEYLGKVEGKKVLCGDDPACSLLAIKHGARTYGIDSHADVKACNLSFSNGASHFTVEVLQEGHYQSLGAVVVPLRGRHNVLNSLAVIAMAMEYGVSFQVCVDALAKFGGVARRYQFRGESLGATFVDDYAHLPNEISAVIVASRDETDRWNRVVAVFQPNRYNRMNVLSNHYANCFNGADLVVVTEIYASGTMPIEGVTGHLVVDAVRAANPSANVVWRPTRDGLVSFLSSELREGDLCISMGCGDIELLPDEVISHRSSGEGTQ